MMLMNKVYIAIISNITKSDRISFSTTINSIAGQLNLDHLKSSFESGLTITIENFENQDDVVYTLIEKLFKYLHDKTLYNEWMDDYTSITFYLLYNGAISSSI